MNIFASLFPKDTTRIQLRRTGLGPTLDIGDVSICLNSNTLDRLREALGVTPAATDPVTLADRLEKLAGEFADAERAEAKCGRCEQLTDTDELDDAGECPECAQRPEREEARREARSTFARSED